MNEFVLGKNVTLRVLVGLDYIPYACATAVQINTTAELIPATTATSGNSRKYRQRYQDWTVTLSGLTYILNTDTPSVTVFDALNDQLRAQGHEIEILFRDEQNRPMSFRGRCLISSISIKADVEDFSDMEIEYQGNGQYAMQEYTPPQSATDVKPIQYISINGGETSYQDTALIGRQLVEIKRSGTGQKIITVGVPGGNEMKFDAATGTISWTPALMPDEWISGLWK